MPVTLSPQIAVFKLHGQRPPAHGVSCCQLNFVISLEILGTNHLVNFEEKNQAQSND